MHFADFFTLKRLRKTTESCRRSVCPFVAEEGAKEEEGHTARIT